MPKFNSVIAGLAISTALAGGVVGVGAATTVTSAAAATSTVTAVGFQAWHGWGNHRCSSRRHTHERFRLIIQNPNRNHNRLHNDNPRLVPVEVRRPEVNGTASDAAASGVAAS